MATTINETTQRHPRLYPATKVLLLQRANELLATGTASKEYRAGICAYIEQILMDFGAYRGFQYLQQGQVPHGELPGIRPGLPAEQQFAVTDCTRRRYL